MALEDYLRSFDSLRPAIEDAPTSEPAFVRPLAAVTLHARLQRRDFRDETHELSQAIADRMPRDVPPAPETWTDTSRTILADPGPLRRCTVCGVRPGFTACPACHGAFAGCEECKEGWVTCTTCDGKKVVLLATIRHVEDREVIIRHTYLPTTTAHLGDALLGLFLEEQPEDCLRFDVDLRSTNAPYRETIDDRERGGMFHEHAFHGAIDRAREAVAAIAGRDWVREEVSAYARPFHWVGWDEGENAGVRSLVIAPSPRAIHVLRA